MVEGAHTSSMVGFHSAMKIRIVVTVDRDLVRAAEKRAGRRSRSHAINHALRIADRVTRAQETAAYFQGLSRKERAEDKRWGELEARAAAALA